VVASFLGGAPHGGWEKSRLWLMGEKEHADRETGREVGKLRDRPIY